MAQPRPFFTWRQALLNSELAPTTRHVLLTLGCHMNDAGESCYPSIELLARETGLSRQSVMEHVRRAQSAGWLVVRQHGLRGRRWARNEYAIAWPETVQPVPVKVIAVNDVDRPEGARGQSDRAEAVKDVDLSTSGSSSGKENVHVAATAQWLRCLFPFS